MEILDLLQKNVDVLLAIFGIVMFLVFIHSSRMVCLFLLVGFLSAVSPARAQSNFTLSFKSFTSTNLQITGFSTGRLYQIKSSSDLMSGAWDSDYFFCSSPSSYYSHAVESVRVGSNYLSAGWYFDPFGGSNWWGGGYQTFQILSTNDVNFFRAVDITPPTVELLTASFVVFEASAGVLLWIVFMRSLGGVA